MQNVSELWKSITAGRYETEIRLLVAGNTVTEDDIFSLKTSMHLFPESSPTAGNAICGQMSTEFKYDGFFIPRMAEIIVQARVKDSSRSSEWIDLGHYFIDTRHKNHVDGLETLSIEGFDAMLKAEDDCPMFNINYPASDLTMVQKIAESINVSIDQRTIGILTSGYSIEFTAGYSKREVLSGIAAMYGGTWIISPAGQLRLVRMMDIPESHGYLITENGAAITFGGVKIIV